MDEKLQRLQDEYAELNARIHECAFRRDDHDPLIVELVQRRLVVGAIVTALMAGEQ